MKLFVRFLYVGVCPRVYVHARTSLIERPSFISIKTEDQR